MPNNSTLILPIHPSLRSGIRRSLTFSLKLLRLFIFFIVFSLVVFCIFQVNAYTKEIYLIQGYEKKLDRLTQEHRVLEINFAKANSLNNVDNYLQNFEKTNKIEYIRILENAVLAK